MGEQPVSDQRSDSVGAKDDPLRLVVVGLIASETLYFRRVSQRYPTTSLVSWGPCAEQ